MSADRAAVPTGARTWLDPDWRAGALAWADRELAARGLTRVGLAEQPHVRPWSTAIRLPTDLGPAWFKASGPGPAHEGLLLRVLAERGLPCVLLPMTVHPQLPWLLFMDGGPTMRATRPDGTGDHEIAAWERILAEYAGLQRSVEAPEAIAAMLAAGTPDGRPARLAPELERLVADDVIWGRLLPAEREAGLAARERLAHVVPEVRAAADRLAAAGVASSIQHDDLHGGNILVGPDGDRIFDWGDAVVAHPFGTLTTTFNSIAHHTGRSLDDPIFGRLLDVYTEAWTDILQRDELVELARLASILGCIGKALAWERSLGGLEPDEMDGHGDAVAGWLLEFADRFSTPFLPDDPTRPPS